jgi:hypothetical protein
MVKTWTFTSGGHTFAAVCVLLTQDPWSQCHPLWSFLVRPDLVSARRASDLGFVEKPRNPIVLWWTTANPANSVYLHAKLLLTWPPRHPGSVLVLWSKPTKPRVQILVVSRHPASAHVHDFVLLFLPPCGPHLIPFGHRVHRAKPTCLSTPRRPCKARTFCAYSSPASMQIKMQPAPTILGQESVQTTSITHH